MFDSNQFFGVSAAGAFYPKTIDQSLRFEDGDSAYLTWMPATTGDRKKHTFSFWYKRGNIGISQRILSGDAGTNFFTFLEVVSDKLYWRTDADTAGTKMLLQTSQVLRDPSAWYHIVVVYDSAQATASDRAKMYVNGTQITAFDTATYPPLNQDSYWNIAGGGYGFDLGGAANYLDGYLAEVHFTDGTAYDADDFGELKSGIWVPKSPSVTYGTNGFKLTFEDSAAIGDDTSGEGNNFTVNSLVASDVVLDSPTNNFCVINPLDRNSSLRSYEGNLATSNSTAAWRSGRATIAVTSGKWYWEVVSQYAGATDERGVYGVANEKLDNTDFLSDLQDANSIGATQVNGTAVRFYGTNSLADQTDTTLVSGSDVLNFAFDADNGDLYCGRNGVYYNSGDPAAGTGATNTSLDVSQGMAPAYSHYGSASDTTGYWNFGQDSTFAGNKTAGGNSDANGIGDFQYAPPSGFLALCTSNLPDPVIDPAQDATPEDYFTAVTYDGNGTSQDITVGFQPDFSWFKSREAQSHILFDVIRGGSKYLKTDTTDAELTSTDLIAFTSDGLTLGHDGSAPSVNGTGSKVVWNWKAGGTGVSNTDGSITSTVSANTDAGFSIATFTGNGTSGATVGHGLNSAPEWVVIKSRSNANGWPVYHVGVASDAETDYLFLNATDASSDLPGFWNDTAPTSSVVTLGDNVSVNRSSGTHVMYCFHSVDGFSKVGSYSGNSSTDGAFIYTGFRPAFILQKRTDAAANWRMWDNRREGYNVDNDELKPNSNVAEGTQDRLDFLSNGFKWRDSNVVVNGSSGNYIYLAFAEQPFKYSNAR